MCTYMFRVRSGRLLGSRAPVGAVRVPSLDNATVPVQLGFQRLQNPALASAPCDFAATDCNFLCLHPDFSGVTDSGQLLVTRAVSVLAAVRYAPTRPLAAARYAPTHSLGAVR